MALYELHEALKTSKEPKVSAVCWLIAEKIKSIAAKEDRTAPTADLRHKRYIELHCALDELMAAWAIDTRGLYGQHTITELMQWSYRRLGLGLPGGTDAGGVAS